MCHFRNYKSFQTPPIAWCITHSREQVQETISRQTERYFHSPLNPHIRPPPPQQPARGLTYTNVRATLSREHVVTTRDTSRAQQVHHERARVSRERSNVSRDKMMSRDRFMAARESQVQRSGSAPVSYSHPHCHRRPTNDKFVQIKHTHLHKS